jgi:hypothetical protein
MILFLIFLLVQEQLGMQFCYKCERCHRKFILVQLPEALSEEKQKTAVL